MTRGCQYELVVLVLLEDKRAMFAWFDVRGLGNLSQGNPFVQYNGSIVFELKITEIKG